MVIAGYRWLNRTPTVGYSLGIQKIEGYKTPNVIHQTRREGIRRSNRTSLSDACTVPAVWNDARKGSDPRELSLRGRLCVSVCVCVSE